MRWLLICWLTMGSIIPVQAQEKQPAEEPAPEDFKIGDAYLALNTNAHVGHIVGLGFVTPKALPKGDPQPPRLVSVGKDRTVRLWDVTTGEQLKIMRLPVFPKGEGRPLGAAVSPNGKTLGIGLSASPTVGSVLLLNLEDGRIVYPGGLHKRNAALVTFSAEGNHLAVADQSGSIHVWLDIKNIWEQPTEAVAAFKPIASPNFGVLRGLSFSPDGSRLLAGRLEGNALIWKWGTAKEEWNLASSSGTLPSLPSPIAWNPDGKSVAVGGSDVYVWSTKGMRLNLLENVRLRPDVTKDKQGRYPNLDISDLHYLDNQHLLVTWHGNPQGASIVDLTGKTPPIIAAKRAGTPGGYLATHSEDQRYHAFTCGQAHNEMLIWSTIPSPKRFRPSETQVHIGSYRGIAPAISGWSKEGRTLVWRKALSKIEGDNKDLNGGLNFLAEGDEIVPAENLENAHFLIGNRGKVIGNTHVAGDGTTIHRSTSGAYSNIQIERPNDKTRRQTDVVHNQIITSFAIDPSKNPGWVAWSTLDHLTLSDLTGKSVKSFLPALLDFSNITPSPDGRWILVNTEESLLHVFSTGRPGIRFPIMTIFANDDDWVVFTGRGYFAASPGGERLMGWSVNNGVDQLATFHPATRFRSSFYRPDVIRMLLDKGIDGDINQALKSADAKRVVTKVDNKIPSGVKAVVDKIPELANFLPPKVSLKILHQEADKLEVEVSAEASSRDQPISELHLLLDGRPIILDAEKRIFTQEKFNPARAKVGPVKWTITIPTGQFKLTARAHGKDTYSISQEQVVQFMSSELKPAVQKRGTLYFVGIGVNELAKDPANGLKWAVGDVEELADCLKTYANRFEKVETILLTDTASVKPTRKEILAALDNVQAKPTDLVIVYFSCHGEKDAAGGLYLLPRDADRTNLRETAVSSEDLQVRLGKYQSQVLLLLDACHSGAQMRSPSDEIMRQLIDDRFGVAVMTAALGHQKAQERDDLKHGLFAYALIKGLGGEAKPDEYNNRLYIHNLYTHAFGLVNKESNGKQMPALSLPGNVPPPWLMQK